MKHATTLGIGVWMIGLHAFGAPIAVTNDEGTQDLEQVVEESAGQQYGGHDQGQDQSKNPDQPIYPDQPYYNGGSYPSSGCGYNPCGGYYDGGYNGGYYGGYYNNYGAYARVCVRNNLFSNVTIWTNWTIGDQWWPTTLGYGGEMVYSLEVDPRSVSQPSLNVRFYGGMAGDQSGNKSGDKSGDQSIDKQSDQQVGQQGSGNQSSPFSERSFSANWMPYPIADCNQLPTASFVESLDFNGNRTFDLVIGNGRYQQQPRRQ